MLPAAEPPTILFALSVMRAGCRGSSLWRPRDEVRPGLRSVVANPHVVFYRVNADGLAEVVRVIDGRRDIDAIFDETEET
jgi:plasmid stabilization system protein ParE